MGLLQAMDASESELLRKLAGEYRRAKLTDAQAADDLLAVVEMFPEVADEIPGFEKVAAMPAWLGGAWNALRSAGTGAVKAVGQAAPAVAKSAPVSTVRAPLPSPFSNTPQPGFRQPVGQYGPPLPSPSPLPAPVVAPVPAVAPAPLPRAQPSASAPKLTPGLKPINPAELTRAARSEYRPAMPAASATQSASAPRTHHGMLGSATPQPVLRPASGPHAPPPAPAGVLPTAMNAVKAAPSAARGVWNETKPFLGSAALGGGTGAVSGAASAAATGQDPAMGALGGIPGGVGLGLMGGGNPRAAMGLGAIGGLGGTTATGTGLTDALQAQVRQKIDPVLGTNLGLPREFTDQDPTRATSAAELEGAALRGGARLNALTPTMVTPEAQAALAQQKRQFADSVMAQATKHPTANPAAALESTMPGINDAVLRDPATVTAMATPQGRAQFAAETDVMEQQLLNANPGTLDPATHGPQLATVAKRRMALAASQSGMSPAEMATRARQIEQNLTDGNLSAEDLKAALSTPAGKQFLDAYTGNAAAGAMANGRPLVTAAPTATPAAAPAADPAVTPDGGAGGGAAAPMDMNAIFQQIGGFASENPAQFAALALGIPIALSGLVMSMSGGPSLGGILALVLGGGLAAGGMGQFGGTDLMSPLQQFFSGGATAPPADPSAPPPVDPAAAAAPTGGAAVPPAATFQLPATGGSV